MQSTKNVIDALDKTKYDIMLLGIDKTGRWHINDQSRFLLNAENPKLIALNKTGRDVAFIPGGGEHQLVELTGNNPLCSVDVVFPILHGPLGEDGTVQGLLKLADIPFVGAGVLGSAVGMDKDVMKRLLREAGLPVAKYLVFRQWEREEITFENVAAALGTPFFVKPANLGSSVGISKVGGKADFAGAIAEGLAFDNKIVIEEFIAGRELECAVLGNDHPEASAVGEIVAKRDFYSYEAKYIDENGAALEIPARLPPEIADRVREMAVKVFRVLCCEGMGRVDLFLTGDNRIIVNEINTIPG